MDVATAIQAMTAGTQVTGTDRWGRQKTGAIDAHWVAVKTRFGTELMLPCNAPEGDWTHLFTVRFPVEAAGVAAPLTSTQDFTAAQLS